MRKLGHRQVTLPFSDFAGIAPLLSTFECGYGEIWGQSDLFPLKSVLIFLPGCSKNYLFLKSSKIQWDMSQGSFCVSFLGTVCILSICRLKTSLTSMKFSWILLWLFFFLCVLFSLLWTCWISFVFYIYNFISNSF